uniref:Uncharacterized protein n=1 Tax=Tanacetum cinerariifolium TaxID=118510 RepID=A0A6L2N257_TANCI|nr:hypothetical protein [Tanacetum cinerariifolium]
MIGDIDFERFLGNDVNRLGPCLMFNGIEGFVPQANSEGVIRWSVSKVVANSVMGDGGSVSGGLNVVAGGVMENSFVEEVANGVMENGVSGASVRAVNNGVAGASSCSLGDVVNGVMGNGVGRAGARVVNNGDARVRSFSLGGAAAGSSPRICHYLDLLLCTVIIVAKLYDSTSMGILAGTKLDNCCTFLFAASVKELDHVRNNIIAGKFLNFLIDVEMKDGNSMNMHIGNCKCHLVSNKALLTFLVVVSELVVGIDGVSNE